MFSFPEGFYKDSVKRKDCHAKIYFCNLYKNLQYVSAKVLLQLISNTVFTNTRRRRDHEFYDKSFYILY